MYSETDEWMKHVTNTYLFTYLCHCNSSLTVYMTIQHFDLSNNTPRSLECTVTKACIATALICNIGQHKKYVLRLCDKSIAVILQWSTYELRMYNKAYT